MFVKICTNKESDDIAFRHYVNLTDITTIHVSHESISCIHSDFAFRRPNLAWKLDDETDEEWAERSKKALQRLSGLSTDTIFFIDLQEEPEPKVIPGKDPRLFPRHLNEDGSHKDTQGE